ncbi:MAG TPA: tRNA pseudouridine(38-40) synthase TruA [Candidatus Avalokitesvara rifleensis]|uniref:tRNA pseudouridine(38-40) synthase TruA n=1 Tax=Candidatus Avalokitesvara rifleensis TaxID=3367620 RepID=UPI004025CC9F
MRNIRLVIEYEGTNYAGWQEQRVKNHSTEGDQLPTIQACVKDAIEKVVGEVVVLYGASRTDAGVHALGQVANFRTSSGLPVEKFVPAINFYLPPDIVVRSAEEVPENFHAQFSARSKVYSYTVLNDRVPCALNRNLSYRCSPPLDVEMMKKASECLTGRHDFSAFSVESSGNKNSIRTIKSFNITQQDRYIRFVVEADGFLYKMIRGIVGTLLLVGQGKLSLEEFKHILDSRDRRLAGPTAPAKGLILLKVNYDEEDQ